MSAYTIAIICPSCGGNASLREGARVVHCPYCDQRSLASHPLGYPTLYVPPKISEEDARLIAEKYVYPQNDHSPRPYLDQNSPVTSAIAVKFRPPAFHQTLLLFIPFWRVQARLIGWVSGQAPVKDEIIEEMTEGPEGGHLRKKILHSGGEPLKRMLVQWQETTVPAVDATELGILRYQWEDKTLKLLPFSPQVIKEGYVLTPRLTALKVRREAEANFLKRVLAPYKNHSDFFHRVKLLRTQVTLFYYPIWLVRGVFRGMDIRRVIDAIDGQVILADQLFPQLTKDTEKGWFGED